MVDVLTPAQRSLCMSRIRGTNTGPERVLRAQLFHQGFRYRLHAKHLPGRPDLVFPRYHAVIFVHGCFWHGHDCRLFKLPGTNTDFWTKKIEKNREHDLRTVNALRRQGWRVLTVWECALRGPGGLSPTNIAQKAARWLHSRSSQKHLRGRLLIQ
jgi:DNA mismatch endonuclease (patch repair protein)